tara:strand:- start:143 stop:373 length:231 start_codon:yes stop_codon:yes gene_type:complete
VGLGQHTIAQTVILRRMTMSEQFTALLAEKDAEIKRLKHLVEDQFRALDLSETFVKCYEQNEEIEQLKKQIRGLKT